MVAYSFHMRFADDVADGRKTQTIRARRKRHARIGEPVQLFTGMRTRHCRKLRVPDPVCVAVRALTIWPSDGPQGTMIHFDMAPEPEPLTDEFAQADGFDDAADFTDFWLEHHGAKRFDGVLIKWAF